MESISIEKHEEYRKIANYFGEQKKSVLDKSIPMYLCSERKLILDRNSEARLKLIEEQETMYYREHFPEFLNQMVGKS